MNALWQIYQNVVFVVEGDFQPARQFAIITAYNPEGIVSSVAENIQRNKILERKLKPFSWQNIIGASPDLSHQEQSFALQSSQEQALTLALEFQQNAIYWVENEELWLLPVLMDNPKVLLGNFKDFLVGSTSL